MNEKSQGDNAPTVFVRDDRGRTICVRHEGTTYYPEVKNDGGGCAFAAYSFGLLVVGFCFGLAFRGVI